MPIATPMGVVMVKMKAMIAYAHDRKLACSAALQLQDHVTRTDLAQTCAMAGISL